MRSFYLPPKGKKDQIEAALIHHREAVVSEWEARSIEWTKAHWYLQGFRGSFTIQGFPSAAATLPTPSYQESSGKRNVRLEMALPLMQTEMGRILSMDLAPAVMRRPGIGLDEVRSTAIAQTAYDNLWSKFNHQDFQTAIGYQLLGYGTVGIGAFEATDAEGGIMGVSLQLIPPWELMPFPSGVASPDQISGVTWRRWVPYDLVKQNRERYGLSIPKDETKLRLASAVAGSHVQSESSPVDSKLASSGWSNRYGDTISTEGGLGTIDYVEFAETWVTADDGTTLRYMVMLGDHLARDDDYAGDKPQDRPLTPVGVARYQTVGSFWGRGFIDRIDSLNKEIEKLLGHLLQNMSDQEFLRFLTIPALNGVNLRQLKQNLRQRILPYEPHPLGPTLRPEILAPPNIGDTPGRTLTLLQGLMMTMSAQGPAFAGGVPGRIESASGLGIVAEQQSVPMIPVAKSLAGALRQVYKCALQIISKRLSQDETLILTRVDESVLGVKYDPLSKTIKVGENPLPGAYSLEVTIRNENPRTPDLVKQTLDDQLQRGIISPIEYQIAAQKEGLDIPFPNRAVYENYVAAWLENIIMFGDGQTPGQTTTNEYADNHVIHMMVHKGLEASVVFRAASPQVRAAFIQHDQYHQGGMGMFPQGLESLTSFGQVGQPPPVSQEALGGMSPPEMPGMTSPMAMMPQ